jgi:hypothetical protein
MIANGHPTRIRFKGQAKGLTNKFDGDALELYFGAIGKRTCRMDSISSAVYKILTRPPRLCCRECQERSRSGVLWACSK